MAGQRRARCTSAEALEVRVRLEGEQLAAVRALVGRERGLDGAPAVVARLIGHSLRQLDGHLFESVEAVAERHPDEAIGVELLEQHQGDDAGDVQLAIEALEHVLAGLARRHAWWGPACGPCDCAWHRQAVELLGGLELPFPEHEEPAGRLPVATVRALRALEQQSEGVGNAKG